jgi:hypothetical protein
MVHQKISHTHVYRASAGFSLLGVSLSLFFGILFVLILCLFTPALGPTRVISDSSRDVFQTEVVVHHLSSTGTVATVWMTDIQGSQKVMTDEIWTDGYDNVLLVNAKSIKDLPKIGKYKRIEIAGDISTQRNNSRMEKVTRKSTVSKFVHFKVSKTREMETLTTHSNQTPWQSLGVFNFNIFTIV